MKKLFLLLSFGLLAALTAQAQSGTVELLPGKITGTISLGSEVVKNGTVYASATDGSGSAQASYTGNSFSLIVPAGKSWRLSAYIYPETPAGGYSYTYVSIPTVIGPVGADQTVVGDIALGASRVIADIQVSNGTLSSIPTLQANGSSTSAGQTTSFSSYSQNMNYVVALPFASVGISGTASVKNNANLTSTQTLSSKTVNASAGPVTATWTVDAAFSAGSILGSVNLLGAVTPSSATIYLYNTNGVNVGSKSLQGNGSFQFENLQPGRHSLYHYVYFPNSQLYFYRYPTIVAGNVSQTDFTGTVALAQTGLNLTGFLTRSNLSGGTLYGYWTPPSTNPESMSMTAYGSFNTTTGAFNHVLYPGDWKFYNVNLSGYDYSTTGVYLSYSLSINDVPRSNQSITFAPGDSKTVPGFDINTTQTELTFDVVEAAGATAETLISSARVSGSATVMNGSTVQSYLNFNANGSTATPQPRQRVRIVGVPGTYNIQTYGRVGTSDVSFGNFTLELKAALPTPVGNDVAVTAGAGVDLVFDHVTAAGVSTASQVPVGATLPVGYSILTNSGQKVYYSVSTTATFTGYVDLTVAYAADAVAPALEPRLKLFYFDNAMQKWLDVTTGVDQVNNKITGTAPALTLFAIGVSHDPVVTSVTVPVDGLKATALSFSALFTDGDSNDTHTATWTWGDGTTSAGTVNATTRAVTGTHTYALAGSYSGSLAVTDATGTTATKTFTVVVGGGDSIPPAITLAGNLTAEATGATGAIVTFNLTALDDTDGVVALTTAPASGSLFPIGTTQVTATARDAAGNTATKTFTVTVADTTKPVISVPSAVTLEATSSAGAVFTYAATANDTVSGALAVTSSPASGSTFPLGATTVTLTAADNAGNVATDTFVVTVVDTTAPVITVPAAVTAEATGSDGAIVNFTASATDLGAAVTVTTSVASGSLFPLGTTTVTVTAKDAANNTTSKTFDVVVRDTVKPVITVPAAVTLEATSAAGATYTFSPTATDAISGAVTVSSSPASGSVFPLGATTVTLTAKDAANNTATETFVVTVRDTTAPVIAPQANLSVEATSAAGAVVTFTPTATDTASTPTVTTNIASGATFPVGTTTVTITAKDGANLTATKTFTVTVVDTTKPVIAPLANLTVEATSAAGATVTFAPTASDNVGATVSVSKASGSVFPLGTTTVTVNAVDAAGNAATPVSFTVTVRDTSGPVLAMPINLVAEATDEDGAKVTFAVTATDLVSGARPVTVSRSSGSKFPLGVTTINVTAKDALGNTTVGTFTVTVRDTTAPKLKLPKNLTVSATSAAGATVRYEVEAEDLVSEDKQITFTYSKASGSVFPLGVTTVTVTAKDKAGNIATGTFTVTVADTTRPVFTKLSITPSRLLTNDRAMVSATVTALAKDRIDSSLNIRIVSVTSDEPVTGTSVGDIGPDWEITGPLTLKLRAERDPKANGRIYTVAVAATDDSGNTTTRTLHVLVTKNANTRFEDCDSQHRSEDQRCKDENRDNDSRNQGDRDDDDDDNNDKKARGK